MIISKSLEKLMSELDKKWFKGKEYPDRGDCWEGGFLTYHQKITIEKIKPVLDQLVAHIEHSIYMEHYTPGGSQEGWALSILPEAQKLQAELFGGGE